MQLRATDIALVARLGSLFERKQVVEIVRVCKLFVHTSVIRAVFNCAWGVHCLFEVSWASGGNYLTLTTSVTRTCFIVSTGADEVESTKNEPVFGIVDCSLQQNMPRNAPTAGVAPASLPHWGRVHHTEYSLHFLFQMQMLAWQRLHCCSM